MYGGFLLVEAQRQAKKLQDEEPQRLENIADLERQVSDLKAESEAAARADDRLADFPADGSRCPRCWIYEAVIAPVKGRLDRDNRTTLVHCERCRSDYRPPTG